MRATYAFIAEVEREKTVYRTNRGRRDRAMESLTGQGQAAYGYLYEDSQKYRKARYILNHIIIHVDEDGVEWSEVKVVRFIFERILAGDSIRQIAFTLTKKGIPTRLHKPYWSIGVISEIARNRWYTGKNITVFRYNRNGKTVTKRDEPSQIHLPDGLVPPIVTVEEFEAVQQRIAQNKQFAMRNNKHQIGILRAGLAVCGICGHNMHVVSYEKPQRGKYYQAPIYACYINNGREELLHKHFVSIKVETLDAKAWKIAKRYIQDPAVVRDHVAQLRKQQEENHQTTQDISASITVIKRKIANLIAVAEAADDDELSEIKGRLVQLRKQKTELETMMIDVEADEEQEQELEYALQKFETWAAQIRPLLEQEEYEPSYDDKRMACIVLGLRAIVSPDTKTCPQKVDIDIAPPSVMKIVSQISRNY